MFMKLFAGVALMLFVFLLPASVLANDLVGSEYSVFSEHVETLPTLTVFCRGHGPQYVVYNTFKPNFGKFESVRGSDVSTWKNSPTSSWAFISNKIDFVITADTKITDLGGWPDGDSVGEHGIFGRLKGVQTKSPVWFF